MTAQLPIAPTLEQIGQPWMDQAACKDHPTDWWFVGRGGDVRPAKKICATCEVKEECILYAIETNCLFGMFGGLTYRGRMNWAKERNIRTAA
jgi:WhiB family transcriptional regulator, redox-sensing transcriptional regulator